MSLAAASFTPEEENLVQLLPPSGPVDSAWINEADSLISGTYRKIEFRFVLIFTWTITKFIHALFQIL